MTSLPRIINSFETKPLLIPRRITPGDFFCHFSDFIHFFVYEGEAILYR